MTLSITLACAWVVTACVIAMFPSRRRHWPAAYVLIAVGVPLLTFVFIENGPVVGLVFLFAGASILRWPVRYAWRWVRRQVAKQDQA